MEKDWVIVFETGQEYQAEIAREILENEGINVVILNQIDSAYRTSGSIDIYVHESQKENALELLKNLKD